MEQEKLEIERQKVLLRRESIELQRATLEMLTQINQSIQKVSMTPNQSALDILNQMITEQWFHIKFIFYNLLYNIINLFIHQLSAALSIA